MSRGLWFAAGAGAGIYSMWKARRAAETLTPEGMRDRWAGIRAGAATLADEVRDGMHERETQLRDQLALQQLDQPKAIKAADAGIGNEEENNR